MVYRLDEDRDSCDREDLIRRWQRYREKGIDLSSANPLAESILGVVNTPSIDPLPGVLTNENPGVLTNENPGVLTNENAQCRPDWARVSAPYPVEKLTKVVKPSLGNGHLGHLGHLTQFDNKILFSEQEVIDCDDLD